MGIFDTVKRKQLVEILLSYGFYERNQTGGHINYKKDGVKDLITIPKHDKEVKLYSVKKVMKILKLTREELEKKLKEF
jgi:predicted RNA binding protein YcfA (HicA-like mRNA interferase family)